MNATTGTPDINITLGTKYKSVSVTVQTFGDRPTTAFKRSPSPNNDDCEVLSNAKLGAYTVTVDWPAGALEPTITITP